MTADTIAALICRELRTLRRELDAYPSDASVWEMRPGLPNSAGTLALHAAGNLLHFFGAVLGQTGYVRDRDAEFAQRDVPRAALTAQLEEAERVVSAVLRTLPAATLAATYPLPVANRRVNTGEFLSHLAVHLAYHLGQVDYHRRVITGQPAGTGAVAPAELPSAVPADG